MSRFLGSFFGIVLVLNTLGWVYFFTNSEIATLICGAMLVVVVSLSWGKFTDWAYRFFMGTKRK